MAALLRKAGARDIGEFTEAAARGEIERMKTLLSEGANVNELTADRSTPLSFAASKGQTEAVRFLLEHGADVNRFNDYGLTARTLVEFLRQAMNHEPNFSPIEGMSAEEAKLASQAISDLIDARHPDIEWRDEHGETALLRGAAAGDSMIAQILSAGTNLNAQRSDGMTALMLAIVNQPKDASREGAGSVRIEGEKGKAAQLFSGRAYLVKTLLEKGADATLRNKAGKTALDLARENGNEEILAVLNPAAK